jgi:4-amino-4-deoxy-L-arabinose transferase-like glycosyltransferase
MRLLRDCFRLVLPVGKANRATVVLGLLIVSAGLVWMALGTFGVPALIEKAYRGESWPIFNSMIRGQASHPVAEYLADWNQLKWTILIFFFIVGSLGVAVASPEFRAVFSRPAALAPEDSARASRTGMPLANHGEAETDLRERRFWGTVAILAFSVVLIATIAWGMRNPYPQGWDEALYVSFAHKDISSLKQSGIIGAIKSFLLLDPARPPGFRLVALPITRVFGDTPAILRTVSVFCLGISVLFVYLTARGIVGPSSGALAAIFLCLNLSIVNASKNFGTESALYLAISTMLYCLFRAWNTPQASTWQWVGLGAALGLGALAKTSFLLIAVPIMLLVLLLSCAEIIAGPSPKFLLKATGVALLLASPWWRLNFRPALSFANYAWKDYTRSSFGSPSLETYAKWLSTLWTSAVGLPLVVLTLLLLLSVLLKKYVHVEGRLDRLQIIAMWVCLLSALPLVVAQVIGNNHMMRLISPSFIPLAIAFGILAQRTRWAHVRLLQIGASVLVLLQLVVVVSGLQLFAGKVDDEQWDWEGLRRISNGYHIRNPLIVHLGSCPSFGPPQIAYPWVRADEPVRVEWLWQHEQGEMDWQKVQNSLNSSDIVLTVPQYAADAGRKRDLDNRYNAELARRLEGNSRFLKPIKLKMGPAQVEVLVFVRKPDSAHHN